MNIIENIIQHKFEHKVEAEAFMYEGEVYTYFDQGLTRHVYANEDKTKVVKILINPDSKDYNLEEAEIYEKSNDDVRMEMAETKLTMNGMVIEQEFCNPAKMDDRKMTIPQMLFASSCRDEVGWNSKGDLVCFDLDEFKKY